MAEPVKILAFAGSLRRSRTTKNWCAWRPPAPHPGAEVTELDLRDLPLPVFDEDLEAAEGLPPNVAPAERPDAGPSRFSHLRAGVQQFHHGRAEKRHRLGVASGGRGAAVGVLRRQSRLADVGVARRAGRTARAGNGAPPFSETSASS